MVRMRPSNRSYRPHSRTSSTQKKRTPLKHKILLLEDEEDGSWSWVYIIGKDERARSPKSWPLMATASRTARTFRELLVNADNCEIIPPETHKYSGLT